MTIEIKSALDSGFDGAILVVLCISVSRIAPEFQEQRETRFRVCFWWSWSKHACSCWVAIHNDLKKKYSNYYFIAFGLVQSMKFIFPCLVMIEWLVYLESAIYIITNLYFIIDSNTIVTSKHCVKAITCALSCVDCRFVWRPNVITHTCNQSEYKISNN